MKKTLFIITSVIHATPNPLSYAPVRSAFTVEERVQQTLQTIQSIRNKMPEAKILFIELGQRNDLPDDLKRSVNAYLYLGGRKEIREATDSPFKGYGEAMGLYAADPWIRFFEADYFFKLSGRYCLNDEFKPSDWNQNGYVGKTWYGNFYTVLYGFPKRLYANWRDALKQSYPALLRGDALEAALPREFNQTIYHIEKLGVSGWASATGQFYSV